MEIGALISIIVSLINFFFGLFILIKNSKDLSSKLYFILSTSASIWALAVGLGRISQSFPTLLLWEKISYIGGIGTALFFFYFSIVFPFFSFFRIRKKNNLALSVLVLPLILFVFLLKIIIFNFDTFVQNVAFASSSKYVIASIIFKFGKNYTLYVLFIPVLFGLALINLFLKYKKATHTEKAQIFFVILGTSISLFSAIFLNLIPRRNILEYNYLAPSFILATVISIAYAITKHHLFNIKVILTELFVGLISFFLLVKVFIGQNTTERLLWLLITIIFLYLGYSLIKSVWREIKRRKKLEILTHQLEKANAELKRIDKSKTEFLSMASHQLRTPLTAIKGYISMSLEGDYGQLSEREKRVLKNVYQSNERLINIVNDLLNISRIDLGKMELKKAPVRINKLIESISQEFQEKFKEKNLKFIFQKSKEPLPEIEADALKISQVISNLLDNALKYTRKGSIVIASKFDPLKKIILISVQDTGEGLNKEEKGKIFESFVRGSAGINDWVQGVGLGLCVAKRYVELHHGKIWVESAGKGRGATFYVALPVK